MDKKSFMRGFGTGVLFAAVILGISCLMRTSDTAVIRKARQLGMTYADSDEKLFDTATPKAKTSAAPKEETAGASPEAGAASTEPKAVQATAKPETTAETEQKTAKATSKPDKSVSKTESTDEEFKKEKDKIKKDFDKFTIHAGEWSYRVSQKLENLGLVSDAKKFDQYLEDNGYSSKIKIGHYTISKDADFEEIAKEITSK